jgi:hypothetical protein
VRRRDAGSEQIRALLDGESERLTRNLASAAGALRVSPDQDFGVPPQTAFDAIEDTRRAYSELLGQVDSIQTSNGAKADVIDALAAADDGLARFASGLETGVSKRGLKRVKSARKVLKRAGADLESAKARL